jgi:hypothetical protein
MDWKQNRTDSQPKTTKSGPRAKQKTGQGQVEHQNKKSIGRFELPFATASRVLHIVFRDFVE